MINAFPSSKPETKTKQPTPEPHAARRAVRYTAVSNAQTAIARQFPALFMAPLAQAVSTDNQRSDDHVAQTAA